MMLRECVKDFIGAPPPYAGHIDDNNLITRLLEKMGRAKAIAANSNHHWPAYLTPVAS